MKRTLINKTLLGMLAGLLLIAPLTKAASLNEQNAIELVKKQLAAQVDFDSAVLEELLDDNYFEVSPVGEIDDKLKVVDFYNIKNKRAAPQIALENTQVRTFGETAVVIANMVFSMTLPNGETSTFTMTGSWVVYESGHHLSVVSAHYTPLRQ